MNQKVKESETRQFKAVFPSTLNVNDTLFGGQALQWMDEVAYITATRFTRRRMFTIHTERIKFLKAVKPDSIIEIIGKVEHVGDVKLEVKVEIFAEQMYGHCRNKVIEGVFVFAALNKQNRLERIGSLMV